MQLVTNSVVSGRWYVSTHFCLSGAGNLIARQVLGARRMILLPEPAFRLEVLCSGRDADSKIFGRDHTRTPPDKAEMASTTILKVRVVNGSGKIR